MKTRRTYSRPTMQVVAIRTTSLLAGSFIETLDDNDPITTQEEILAPELGLTIGELYKY